jgi:hypothetical protein
MIFAGTSGIEQRFKVIPAGATQVGFPEARGYIRYGATPDIQTG